MALAHKGTQQIKTQRLILRRFTAQDADGIYDHWASDENVTCHLSWAPHQSREITRSILSIWLEHYADPSYYHWGIAFKSTGELIGSVNFTDIHEKALRASVGYCIGQNYWGHGLMTEALRAVIDFGFAKVGFARIQAYHDLGNAASGRVMQKSGMVYEGRLRKYAPVGTGELSDCKMYAVIREDWERQSRAREGALAPAQASRSKAARFPFRVPGRR